ncbi:MAG: 4-hydroxy-tetrahydrodipicolinate reductase [Desulfobacterota bacterium]|nr:4-hydroxy-tetrahydrodipicolinate reductase [Thermodesulfobacteriota bacterium]MDW8001238.1 4-hydroxy-tetrahydrodipicolinate reductase [Deltaproteobacteria bacterium]
MIRIAVTGALGRMGKTVIALADTMEEFDICGAVEKKDHPACGKTLKELGLAKANIPVVSDLSLVIENCDVVIDFTEPSASLYHFEIAKNRRKAIVIGTTGFSEDQIQTIRKERNVRAVISPNMSVGVNVMFAILKRLAPLLGKDYDVEIVEIHHRLKRDAPSGTALKMRDIIMGTNPEVGWQPVYGRHGITGERKKGEIGILSVRGGDVIGEHTVIFFGPGERLEITHKATSRENFGRGALIAAKWIVNMEEGIYSMEDVLGLKI